VEQFVIAAMTSIVMASRLHTGCTLSLPAGAIGPNAMRSPDKLPVLSGSCRPRFLVSRTASSFCGNPRRYDSYHFCEVIMRHVRFLPAALLLALSACGTETSINAPIDIAPAYSASASSSKGKLQSVSSSQSGNVLTINFRIVGLGSSNGNTLYVIANNPQVSAVVECRNPNGKRIKQPVSGTAISYGATPVSIDSKGNASGSVTATAQLPQSLSSYCPTGHTAEASYSFTVGSPAVLWQFTPFAG